MESRRVCERQGQTGPFFKGLEMGKKYYARYVIIYFAELMSNCGIKKSLL